MNHYPSTILNLIRNLSRLPGIGEKTAERLTMHILRAPQSEAEQLVRSILDLKKKITLCSMCYGLSDSGLCKICSNSSRNSSLLCVVENPSDMVAIEKAGGFNGLFHILHGALSPMDGIGPDDIKIKELISRVAEGKVKEVVIATGTNVEGEATASYIMQRLNKLSVKVTRIASGIPIGGDLKYVDKATIKRAMETRHAV